MDTKIEEAAIAAEIVKARTLRLDPGEVAAVVELTVRDKNGRITHREEMVSRSFVRQWLELLYIQALSVFYYTGYTVKDIYGVLQEVSRSGTNFTCNAGIGEQRYGVVIGTGTTAPDINDYQMESLIEHGTGVGQMECSAVTFGAPATDGTTSQFTVTRDFANNSGGVITVREIGLYVRGSTSYYLGIRDAVNIAVPDGETLTVNYRIQGVI
jgi:hypothetical protein